MSQYITLLGAEDVQRAASTMSSAANDMQQAANTIDAALQQNQQFMNAWLDRLEMLLREE